MEAEEDTFLSVFTATAASPELRELDAVVCLDERWTYGDLHSISTGLALELTAYTRPVVAIISENHPYTLAMNFAIWKLGGTIAPIDVNTPPELQRAMLQNIAPHLVVFPGTDTRIQAVVTELGIVAAPFDPATSTMTVLSQRYMHISPDAPILSDRIPMSTDTALYIHTSSATRPDNIKAVILPHHAILANARCQLAHCRRIYPAISSKHLQVLGWCPFSHIISYVLDIGALTLLTRGTYHFSLPPVNYSGVRPSSRSDDHVQGIVKAILDTAIQYDTLTAVPWVITGLMNASEHGDTELLKRLQAFKMIMSGGAQTDNAVIGWAIENGVPLSLSIGMTELAGGLFLMSMDQNPTLGWLVDDVLLPNARLTLLGEDGDVADTGELIVTCKQIAPGYLNRPSSAFIFEADGCITFATGDIYTRTLGNRLIWQGRKDDYIQLRSGETLDPRDIERAVIACQESTITGAAVVGDKFFDGPSSFICLIAQLYEQADRSASIKVLTRALATINRTLSPPFRIAWSRVLVLDDGEKLPMTAKGLLFRKKLKDLYGNRLMDLLSVDGAPVNDAPTVVRNVHFSRLEVEQIVFQSVVTGLRLTPDLLLSNSERGLADMGMTSAMAIAIVNDLNKTLALDLPLNICHVYNDIHALTEHVLLQCHLSHPVPPVGISSSRSERLDDVVIVGQSIRLPGNITSPESFWNALVDKRTDIMTDVPKDRWDQESFYRPPTSDRRHTDGDITFSKSGFINIADYDNAFFGISPSEALFISPSNRLVLEAAFLALEDANITPSQVKGTDLGVYVASGLDDGYESLLFADKSYEAYGRFFGAGVAHSTASGRINYLLDVHGPSITIDTACSSGMVAFDLAVQDICSGRADSALVIAVNTHTRPSSFSFISAQSMSSPNSRCATFSDMADGYVPAEGIVAFVLKKKSIALRDGNDILGAVISTETRHNGRTQGLTAPSVKAQSELQRRLLFKAGLVASEIDFIEAHGTGTSLGDLIEIQAINETFAASHSTEKPLIIGAAKSVVGHTELAAGLVGIAKTLKSLDTRVVPGIAHLTGSNLNPALECFKTPLAIPHSSMHMKNSGVLRSMTLSYGFSGTISGTIIESFIRPASTPDPSVSLPLCMLFVVSAKSMIALLSYLKSYLVFCQAAPSSTWRSICYTSCIGREHYSCRYSHVVKSMDDIITGLTQRLSRTEPFERPKGVPRLVFAFPGQGIHYPGMAEHLYMFPSFQAVLNHNAQVAENATGFSVFTYLIDKNALTILNPLDCDFHSQICIFTFQCSVGLWLGRMGIKANATIGHSLGEIASAVISGIITYEMGVSLVLTRERALAPSEEHLGAMAAIHATEPEIDVLLTLLPNENVHISIFNNHYSHVVSGSFHSIEKFIDIAKSMGFRITKLNVKQGFHSPMIDLGLPHLITWAKQHGDQAVSPQIPFVSSSHGFIEIPNTLPWDYWVSHARSPVRFDHALQSVKKFIPDASILDLGPKPTIWVLLQGDELWKNNAWNLTTKIDGDQLATAMSFFHNLFDMGITPDFRILFDGLGISRTKLPMYPFQRQRYYPVSIPSRSLAFTKSATLIYPITSTLLSLLDGHRINSVKVLPGAAILDFIAKSTPSRAVQSVNFHMPLGFSEDNSKSNNVSLSIDSSGSFSFVHHSEPASSAVSSGLISANRIDRSLRPSSPHANLPSEIFRKDEIYNQFTSAAIHFGPAFRNIHLIQVYPDHADIHIKVEPSGNSFVDRIRALDATLHAFGAISRLSRTSGFPSDILDRPYLPASLEGFQFYSEEVPHSFICRYYLPFSMKRNFQVMSLSFDIISHTGEIIAQCERYSVAYIAFELAIKPDIHQPNSPLHHLMPVWVPSPSISSQEEHHLLSQSRVLCLSISELSVVSTKLKVICESVTSFSIHDSPNFKISDGVSVVVDLSSMGELWEMETVQECCNTLLACMQRLLASKVRLASFVVVTVLSQAEISSSRPASTALGAIVQGMLRVFRRESGLAKSAWGLDLPLLEELHGNELDGILLQEFDNRQSTSADTIAWRRGPDGSLARMVPTLQPLDTCLETEVNLGSVVIITGMGSIGKSICEMILPSATVIFLSRRSSADNEVVADISRLSKGTQHRIAYFQVDISNQENLRDIFKTIVSKFGTITSIIHTAAVVKDSPFTDITPSDFQAVIAPKASGAWNLHLLSLEFNCALNSFVMLSSISVLLGNPGQTAYVAGNSLLDWLAIYRQGLGLAGTSLQLGAWESNLVRRHLPTRDIPESLVPRMTDAEGIPLLMKAIASAKPVQLISKLNLELLRQMPFAKDSLFEDLLKDVAVTEKDDNVDVEATVLDILAYALELDDTSTLDISESLTSHGIDSISFALVRAQLLTKLGVELPLKFLSEQYSIRDIIAYFSTSGMFTLPCF